MGGGRGGGMGRGGGAGNEARSEPAVSAFSEKDVDNLDPVRVIVDKAKVLKLSDGQKKALDSLASPFEWNVHIWARRIDSLQNALREERMASEGRSGGRPQIDSAPPSSSAQPTPAAPTDTRRLLVGTLQSIRQARDSAEARSLRLLDDSQKSKAVPMLGEGREKLEAILTKSEFPNGRGGGVPLEIPPIGTPSPLFDHP